MALEVLKMMNDGKVRALIEEWRFEKFNEAMEQARRGYRNRKVLLVM